MAWLLAIGCASCSYFTQVAPNADFLRSRTQGGGRQLMVFLDGTSNEWNSRTNVRRLFEIAAAAEDPDRLCLYVEGVGVGAPVLGNVLGTGMRARAKQGYRFLAENYREGDRISIFGFSRGAHQARFLAGVISFCGLLHPDRDGHVDVEAVFDYCDTVDDEATGSTFVGIRDACIGFLAKRHELYCRRVDIDFLGVWDTVPGSQFKKYSDTRELPDDKPGTRYKLRPYPPVKLVAHAMSIDEKRSQFRPVRLGEALDPRATAVHEVWFPGAHADVGGGYSDSNALAGVSLNWMLSLLAQCSILPASRVHEDALAVQHHSEAGGIASFGSDVVDRTIPPTAVFHPSFLTRLDAAATEHEIDGDYVMRAYEPRWSCDDSNFLWPAGGALNRRAFDARYRIEGVVR